MCLIIFVLNLPGKSKELRWREGRVPGLDKGNNGFDNTHIGSILITFAFLIMLLKICVGITVFKFLVG